MSEASTEPERQGNWAKLRRRKVVQWGAAYAAAAWSTLQALEYAIETFRWPGPIRPLATIALVVGLPIVVVVAWYHGDRGQQRVTAAELAIVALLCLAGGWLLWRYEPAIETDAASRSAVAGSVSQPRVPPAGPSVAVLPFKALSSGTDDGYFADGVTEEIINALGSLPDLLVTARTSAFHFKGKDVPVPEIAATLGVAHVVDGSVRRAGDSVRITAHLVRASDGFEVWSAAYDQPLTDPFAVQTRIAEQVAAALGVLLDERKRRMMADVGVRDVDAFVAYQRGVDLFYRAHNEGPMIPLLAQASLQFDQAIARKPDFASAYFHRADYFAHLLIDEAPGRGPGPIANGLDAAEARQRLLADLDAAFRHERAADQRRVIQVLRTTVSADWRHLNDQIVSAFAGWKSCRHGLWIDQTALAFGHGEAALRHDLERQRCDPLDTYWTRLPVTAVWLGRPEEGLKYADHIEKQRGQDRDVMYARILAYLALGRQAEAEALLAAGDFDAAGTAKAMALLAIQVAAAAGRDAEWPRLRTALAGDPGRLLVAAAVFGDRKTANRAAAAIDSMTLGPAILLRVADRCGCGRPFDLDSAPNFARQIREGNLPWSPPAPIKFPLKTW